MVQLSLIFLTNLGDIQIYIRETEAQGAPLSSTSRLMFAEPCGPKGPFSVSMQEALSILFKCLSKI